jgi:hypothetical protein
MVNPPLGHGEEPVEEVNCTFEEAKLAQIAEMRDRANQMEAHLYALPPAVRRLTRGTARKLDIYF